MNDVADRGAGNARKIDAPMFLKVLVFDGRDGVEENSGALLVRHQDPALQRKAADELSVVRVNFRNNVRPVGFERMYFRQVAGVNEQQARSRAQENRADKKKR